MMLNEVGRRYNIFSGPTIMQEMFQRHEVKSQRSVLSLEDGTLFKINSRVALSYRHVQSPKFQERMSGCRKSRVKINKGIKLKSYSVGCMEIFYFSIVSVLPLHGGRYA